MKDDYCVCGHAENQHIYSEGACRPGFVCDCPKFRLVELLDKKYKKGTTVTLFCCTHDAQSKESQEYTLEDDMTEDEVMGIAEDFAHNAKELEWWFE